jgi:hypothetical protein
VKRADFDWRPVVGALAGGDLSGRYNERGYPRRSPLPPASPSPRYEERLRALCRRVTAPEREKGREYGITVAEFEAEIDRLFADLAQAEPAGPEIARRREVAAAWLVEAKRQARRTRTVV